MWAEIAENKFNSMGAMGGDEPPPGSAAAAALSTTVSPNFQQSFTPQVSPVIQVSSGSGDQRGATSQTATGGQEAHGGAGGSAAASASAGPEGATATAEPGYSTLPQREFNAPNGGGYPAPASNTVFDRVFQDQNISANWPILLVSGIVLTGVVIYMRKRSGKKV